LTICYNLEVEGREAKEKGKGGRKRLSIQKRDKMRQRAKQGRAGQGRDMNTDMY
jgi:hypothetical protein